MFGVNEQILVQGRSDREAEKTYRQRGAFSCAGQLVNGKTRYRVSAAGYFMTLVREFASQEAGPPDTAIAAIRRRTKSAASTGSGSI
jgi:hypothetical protein